MVHSTQNVRNKIVMWFRSTKKILLLKRKLYKINNILKLKYYLVMDEGT